MAYTSDVAKKQDTLVDGVTIKKLNGTSLLGKDTIYLDTGSYSSHNHLFGQDPDMDNKLVDQNTIQGELEDMSIGYTQFGQARLLQLTIRFKTLGNIQNLMFSWEALGIQISNDFGNFHGDGVVIARVSNGYETEMVEVESMFMSGGRGFRVTSSPSIGMGGNCSLTMFMYGM